MIKLINRGALLATVIISIGAIVVLNSLSYLTSAEPDEVETVRDRSEIALADLSRTIEAEGDLRYTDATELTHVGAGTLTWLPSEGSNVSFGNVLYRVDNVPVILLEGQIPAYRTMSVGDVGADVEQLETALADFGYDPSQTMTIDDTFTSYTATVVERWQAELGMTQTGEVSLGSVRFSPSALTVGAHVATTGQPVGTGPVLAVSSSEREVTFLVDTADLDTIDVGTLVSARLPDRSEVTASVTSLVSGSDGWIANATLEDPGDLTGAALVPVTVRWTETLGNGVSAVPAVALTRLDSGFYAVEVVNDDSTTEFVRVEVGAKSGNLVEVVTDLPPGTIVVAP